MPDFSDREEYMYLHNELTREPDADED